MRFAPKNRVRVKTSTTGTGSYVIGAADPSYQSFSNLADGSVFPYWCQYGSQWETGIGTKSGSLVLRTKILESTNGNGAVDWPNPSTSKTLAIDFLAQNVVMCPDGSITIEDDPQTGATNIRGLKLSDVALWLRDQVRAGIDLKITPNNVNNPTSFDYDVLRTPVSDSDASIITLDLSKNGGSSHFLSIAGNRQIRFSGSRVGQEFLVKLDYDLTGNRKILWPDQEEVDPVNCIIEWVNGYRPEFTPVGLSSDAFKFQRVADVSGIPKFIGWIVSTERPVILEGECLSCSAAIEVTQEGSVTGPNELKWLTLHTDSDYMDYSIVRDGTVSGGTFDLEIQLSGGIDYVIQDIPYDVTDFELMSLIWDEIEGDYPVPQLVVNVDGGTDGADCGAKATDPAGVIRIQFLAGYKYLGWVLSIDATNLTGGGTYTASAVGAGSGTDFYPFDATNLPAGYSWNSSLTSTSNVKLEFAGQQTSVFTDMSVNSIKQKLESLSNIGVGNIEVTKTNFFGTYLFEFKNALRSQNITGGDIKYVDGFLPTIRLSTQSGFTEYQATGQDYSTSRNGTGPVGNNEIHKLTLTGLATSGSFVLTILGEQVTIPFNATAQQVDTLIEAEIGAGNVSVTGGALPASPVFIEFTGDYAYTDVATSTVDVGTLGDYFIDWSICEGARVYFISGAGSYQLNHINPIPGKTLHVTLKNIGSTFPATLTTTQQGRPAAQNQTALNEIQRLSFDSPTPTSGSVVIYLLGELFQFSYNATNQQIENLIESKLGPNFTIGGGPLPGTPITITFIGKYAAQNIEQSLVIYPSSGPVEWGGIPVTWGDADPPEMPTNGNSVYLEFYAETTGLILGKTWFHTGEGGGSGNLEDQLIPGYSIEIDHDVDEDEFHIHNIHKLKTDVDASTIIIDLDEDVGADHEVTINGNRNIGVTNEQVGKQWRLKLTQGTAQQGTPNQATRDVTFLFDVEWAEGYEPVQSTVAGHADLYEFLCLEESDGYNPARFKGWVETTERPQPLVATGQPIAANETQRIVFGSTPTGGTWTITILGLTTLPIPHNATAATVRSYLEQQLGVGNVLVTGGTPGVSPFVIEFVNQLGGTNLPQLSVQSNLLF